MAQYALSKVAHYAYQMNLKEFLSTLPRGGVAAFAGQLRITPVYLSQLAARQDDRAPSPELCVVIERASERAVHRWDLRPADWHRIWPELIDSPDAPAIAPISTIGALSEQEG